MADDKLWFKDENYGKLGQVARQSGGLGNELKHAAKFTKSYWKKKAKGAKESMTITHRDPIGKHTQKLLSQID